MITRYTPPIEMIDEFRKDREKARYWFRRMMDKTRYNSKNFKNFKSSYLSSDKDLRSVPIEYHSPQYGNHWLMWWRFISTGYQIMPQIKDYQVCYQLTEPYMTIILPTKIFSTETFMRGVTIFTSHVFLRMHERLGVDMSDRKLVIRNFVEQVMCGCVDIRSPRPGEKHMQAICRIPGSWLRGHIIYIGDSYLCQFNTFYTDKDLTPFQKRYLKTFAKFADAFNSKDEIREYFTQKEDSNFDRLNYGDSR